MSKICLKASFVPFHMQVTTHLKFYELLTAFNEVIKRIFECDKTLKLHIYVSLEFAKI
jgi:hypothetical protein